MFIYSCPDVIPRGKTFISVTGVWSFRGWGATGKQSWKKKKKACLWVKRSAQHTDADLQHGRQRGRYVTWREKNIVATSYFCFVFCFKWVTCWGFVSSVRVWIPSSVMRQNLSDLTRDVCVCQVFSLTLTHTHTHTHTHTESRHCRKCLAQCFLFWKHVDIPPQPIRVQVCHTKASCCVL